MTEAFGVHEMELQSLPPLIRTFFAPLRREEHQVEITVCQHHFEAGTLHCFDETIGFRLSAQVLS